MIIQDLTNFINGNIIGKNDFFDNNGFTGRFTFLNDAVEGDIVIRHKINGKGVEIAADKKAACLITQTPQDDACDKARELEFPLIIVDKIELATAFALKWTIENFSPDSKNIIITGTNGKSTTSHLIYHILKNAGFHVLTNTDSESEFNTLIDPMVSKLISDEVKSNGKLDYLVIEVSEVQGWLGNLMKHHAYLMANAVNPSVGVITNIAMDHIGLVNSVGEVFNEINQVPKAIGDGVTVLNYDDELVMKLSPKHPFLCSMNKLDSKNNNIYYDNGIFYGGELILENKDLPFTSHHFVQNILSAVAACISLDISMDDIIEGVKSYKALNRRFSKLNDNPLILDDFAHNPDGIKATIAETLKLLHENQILYVVCSIRGSRGVEINKLNVEALVESMNDNIKLILSSSNDVVDNLNFVEDEEREIFFKVLNQNNIDYTHFDNLNDCLKNTYDCADAEDIILLIGAQGMDPASGILENILRK
ncbi:Mur ligase family protein [uncultured Methanobrevibacter sp.]|uniref:Mur ligase family protein n=1 Tax=uncultured Methanobrevibacter sp. TaxID=253161 RepID=UPI00262E66BA|nr:Mur ligase family protein [uncultured Methanobrevibacter sp.]